MDDAGHSSLHCEIVSAEGLLFSGTARRVFVPGEQGELGILPQHAPLLARLKHGLVRVVRPTPEIAMFFISGGFVEVQPDQVTVLADTAVRNDALDATAAVSARTRAEQALAGAVTPMRHAQLEAEIRMYAMLLRMIEEARVGKRAG